MNIIGWNFRNWLTEELKNNPNITIYEAMKEYQKYYKYQLEEFIE